MMLLCGATCEADQRAETQGSYYFENPVAFNYTTNVTTYQTE